MISPTHLNSLWQNYTERPGCQSKFSVPRSSWSPPLTTDDEFSTTTSVDTLATSSGFTNPMFPNNGFPSNNCGFANPSSGFSSTSGFSQGSGSLPRRKRSSKKSRRDLESPQDSDEDFDMDSASVTLRPSSLATTPSRRSRNPYYRQQL